MADEKEIVDIYSSDEEYDEDDDDDDDTDGESSDEDDEEEDRNLSGDDSESSEDDYTDSNSDSDDDDEEDDDDDEEEEEEDSLVDKVTRLLKGKSLNWNWIIQVLARNWGMETRLTRTHFLAEKLFLRIKDRSMKEAVYQRSSIAKNYKKATRLVNDLLMT
ncbi:unnamed protein product [Arabidopsis thaliana]|uniref:Uncharacterized protein n=1 Tax=Arabidopsis thaliana TaxID=3702 RepID=A0A5S9XJK3_ARATH|nr:unnamed protein product [Arabidopsis thaliana]